MNKDLLKLFILLTFFALGTFNNAFSSNTAKYQFNLNVGSDNPDTSATRSGNATLIKFAISTRPKIFRLVGGFTYLTGGGLQQGEFSVGPHIYPFASIPRTPIQPFLYAEGAFGIGSYLDEIRYDAGYGIGLGIDFQLFKKSGFTFAIEQLFCLTRWLPVSRVKFSPQVTT